MTSAVDLRRPVESNSQNTMRDSANTVMLSGVNKTDTVSSFKKVLAAGESQSQSTPVKSGSTESNDKSAANKQIESEKNTDSTLKDQNHADETEAVSSEASTAEKTEVESIDSDLLTEYSLDTGVSESIAISVGDDEVVETPDVTPGAGTDEAVAETEIKAQLTDSRAVEDIAPLEDKNQAGTSGSADQAIPETTLLAAVPVTVSPGDADSNTLDAADAATLAVLNTADPDLEATGSLADKPSVEIPTAPLQVSDTNLTLAVAGNKEITSAKETTTPVLVNAMTDAEAQPGVKTTEIPMVVSNSATSENAKSALLSDARRQVQPATAIDTNNSSAGVAVVSDINTATRASTFNTEGARPQTFEGLSQTTGNHIKMMMEQGIGRATVQLHPAELGSMRINIDLKADQLNVQISVVQGNTREALESALPRLRAQLEADGFSGININLEGGQTGDRRSGQMSGNEQVFDLYNDSEAQISNVLPGRSEIATPGKRSLIDLFA